MAHFFPGTAGKPEWLYDLTPLQFDALSEAAEELRKGGG
jgi:hypothetical protein